LGALVRNQVVGHLERIADMDDGDLLTNSFFSGQPSFPNTGAVKPRFDNVSCSSCGNGFGPGDNGFSHCESHAGMKAIN
jgi:hypothetical protein